jgi:hypothetical protein
MHVHGGDQEQICAHAKIGERKVAHQKFWHGHPEPAKIYEHTILLLQGDILMYI